MPDDLPRNVQLNKTQAETTRRSTASGLSSVLQTRQKCVNCNSDLQKKNGTIWMTRMSENMIAASNPKRRIGCNVTSAAIRIKAEVQEASGASLITPAWQRYVPKVAAPACSSHRHPSGSADCGFRIRPRAARCEAGAIKKHRIQIAGRDL